jgi:hypothetical protein
MELQQMKRNANQMSTASSQIGLDGMDATINMVTRR